MFHALPYKTKQFFFVLIKLSIVIGAFYFIYNKITSNNNLDFNEFVSFLSKKEVFSLKNILFLLFLSFFNWFFEILKWQLLVTSIKKTTFNEALNQSLGSLTASLFTPNRIGEYGAKALYFTSDYRKRIVLLNFLGNLMQMTITVLLGLLGLYYFTLEYDVDLPFLKISRFLILLPIIFLFSFLGRKKKQFKGKGFSIENGIAFIKNQKTETIVSGFLFSLLRYFIFSFQFYYLLSLFGIEATYFHAMVAITSMYLIASIIPSIFLLDVIVKGSVAVFIFSIVGVNEFTILSIVLLMWILNFVLPSIVGSYYVLRFKLPKNKTV